MRKHGAFLVCPAWVLARKYKTLVKEIALFSYSRTVILTDWERCKHTMQGRVGPPIKTQQQPSHLRILGPFLQ
jgi:hypothetical protein